MGASFRGDDDDPIAEINVVPLVDIILVVLIIFMVTAPMVMKESIDVNLPQASSGKPQKEAEALNVVIDNSGQFFLDGKPITAEALKQAASNAAKNNLASSAILTADKAVTLEKLTSVIDTIKSSGIKKVGFSIEKKGL